MYQTRPIIIARKLPNVKLKAARQALRRNSEELLKTEYDQLARSHVTERLLRDRSLGSQIRRHCPDRHAVDAETHLVVTRSATSQITRHVAANRDITERKRIE